MQDKTARSRRPPPAPRAADAGPLAAGARSPGAGSGRGRRAARPGGWSDSTPILNLGVRFLVYLQVRFLRNRRAKHRPTGHVLAHSSTANSPPNGSRTGVGSKRHAQEGVKQRKPAEGRSAGFDDASRWFLGSRQISIVGLQHSAISYQRDPRCRSSVARIRGVVARLPESGCFQSRWNQGAWSRSPVSRRWFQVGLFKVLGHWCTLKADR